MDELKLCKPREPCMRCDLAYIIKDYVHPLIQLLGEDLGEYNMELQTTKCLNTGVMLMLLIAGKSGLKATQQCDSVKVTSRHEANEESNAEVMSKLVSNTLSRTFSSRHLYYVLLTDGHFQRGSENIYFPGHVFILEKFKEEGGKAAFNMYQSYINRYDLNGHFENMNGTMKLSYKKTAELLKKLSYIILNGTWDEMCTKYWKDITSVDAPEYEGYSTTKGLYTCFSGVPAKACVENVKRYATQKLKTLERQPPNNHPDALTKGEMMHKLQELLKKLAIKSANKIT